MTIANRMLCLALKVIRSRLMHLDSGLRQHAMLNLARMYFLRRELAACRKVGNVILLYYSDKRITKS